MLEGEAFGWKGQCLVGIGWWQSVDRAVFGWKGRRLVGGSGINGDKGWDGVWLVDQESKYGMNFLRIMSLRSIFHVLKSID
jgi:hypothetical protein